MKHVNLPKNGIECPNMWVQYDSATHRVTLFLGEDPVEHRRNPREYPLDTVAQYLIFDPVRDSDKTMTECINEVINCLKRMKPANRILKEDK